MRVPPLWIVAVLVSLPLAGCGELNRMFRPAEPVPIVPAERTFDLPEAYEVIDVRYTSDLVAQDSAFGERATVQVFAEHVETGERVLFVFDLAVSGTQPTSVFRFRPVASEPERVYPEPPPGRTSSSRTW